VTDVHEAGSPGQPNEEIQSLIGTLDVPVDETVPITPSAIRDAFAQFVSELNKRGDVHEVAVVVNEFVPSPATNIPVRRYEPTGNTNDVLDVLVFLHGGGWVAGDVETGDAVSRALAVELQCRVVSVDYRRAPESPFPAAFDDCLSVVRHVIKLSSTRNTLVVGESAGGNLAAAVALAMRGEENRLAGQVLINPVLDVARESPSYERLGVGYGLRAADMRSYAEWYAGGKDRWDERISPLLADSLKGVAPAVIVTAGFDPLHDEAVAYVARLVGEDIPVVFLPMPTLLHGWWSLLPVSEEARRQGLIVMEAIRYLQRIAQRGTF
jgi:acetyl esterase